VGDNQSTNSTRENITEKTFKAFLVVVHSRTEVGDYLKRPALLRAEQFED
jgi:hypothetical protein